MLDVDVHVLRADDRALAHTARDDRGVARHAAARGQHGTRGDDSVKVLRRRFVAHENDLVAGGGALLGDVRIEHGDAARRARTRRQSGAQRRRAHVGVDDRMQQLIELLRQQRAARRSVVSISPSSTMSVAMRTAAAAVRFPVRVCSRKRCPRSTVNSMSCMSRKWCSNRSCVCQELRVRTRASACAISSMSSGVRMPATTSSPCALTRNSP